MNLVDAFAYQAESCARMGSPFMDRLFAHLSQNWDAETPLGQYFDTFSGDLGPAGHSLPLRLAGGLHALVLDGLDDDLATIYPPNNPAQDLFADTVTAAISRHMDFLCDWTRSPPQTNEVRRSGPLIAMAQVACTHFDRPIHLSELGASGGLNLMWDHFALEINGSRYGPDNATLCLKPDWSGDAPEASSPRVASRAGVDLNPLDPSDPADRLRLLAYLWPDQPDRMTRTLAAIAVQDTKIDKGCAVEWLEHRLQTAPDGQMHLIQHTVAWQYFPAAKQAEATRLIEDAGNRATPETPLAWMSLETEGDNTGAVGAAMTLRLWPGDLHFHLGYADFHGRWIRWNPNPPYRNDTNLDYASDGEA